MEDHLLEILYAHLRHKYREQRSLRTFQYPSGLDLKRRRDPKRSIL